MAKIQASEMPAAIAALPRNRAGYPVPYFVTWIGGEPDFHVVTPEKMLACIQENRCWTCGGHFGLFGDRAAFVVGPMCAVNRTSGEPPSHLACARYAAKHCPFLTIPKMTRSKRPKLEGTKMHSGGLERNPGVTLLWIPAGPPTAFRSEGTFLFDMGPAKRVEWYAEGREATRAEILHSIETGLPALEKMARDEGAEAMAELERRRVEAIALLPAA